MPMRDPSHESALRRMQERFKQHRRIELDDLLRYLEDVSSEPAGKEAYGLALSIRSMSLPDDHLLDLLIDARHRLSGFHRIGFAHESIRATLDDAARFLNTKLRQKQKATSNPDVLGKQDNGTGKTSQQPASGSNVPEDPEAAPALKHGYEISKSLRDFYKWQMLHNMAALALYWTCFKPSSPSSKDPSVWIEEDVIHLFP